MVNIIAKRSAQSHTSHIKSMMWIAPQNINKFKRKKMTLKKT